MRVLGIDPGTATTGFGVVEAHQGKLAFVGAGVISTTPDEAMSQRLATIYQELNQLVDEFKPAGVAIELLYFATNVTTAMTVGQARGISLLVAAQHGLPVSEYTPLQVKQSVTGYGKATKAQIQEMVKALLGLQQIPRPDDAADALAIAITHTHHYKMELAGA